MKFLKFIEALARGPIPMLPEAIQSTLMDFAAKREGEDKKGNPVKLDQMIVDGNLAIIPVKGPLGIDLSLLEKGNGATDYADIIADTRAANADDRVETIVGLFDTPGGMWGGLQETSNAIAASEKPFYCYVPPGAICGSAGMHLAAACAGRFIAPSAQVGGIGVFCAYTDMSALAEKLGVKVTVISSGDYKGMGVPGTPLTEKQAAFLKAEVMDLAAEFYDHMRKCLGGIPDDAMQGQMFRSEEALALGFADDILPSLESLKGFLR